MGRAKIVERETNRLVLEASANRPGMLVVLEAWRRGWTATVDGQPAPLLRTNAIFRGVLLPAGRHRVEMHYRPPELAWGAAFGVFGMAGLLALGLLAYRARRAP